MDDPPRSVYVLDMHDAPTAGSGTVTTTVEPGHVAALGALMERAYSGTIDDDLGDNSDGEIEVQGWLDSDGRPDVSRLVVDDDRALSACLISLAPSGTWWVGYVFTDPSAKARGLGAAVVASALRDVWAAGGRSVRADVTDGNTPSEKLLLRLGFRRIGVA